MIKVYLKMVTILLISLSNHKTIVLKVNAFWNIKADVIIIPQFFSLVLHSKLTCEMFKTVSLNVQGI